MSCCIFLHSMFLHSKVSIHENALKISSVKGRRFYLGLNVLTALKYVMHQVVNSATGTHNAICASKRRHNNDVTRLLGDWRQTNSSGVVFKWRAVECFKPTCWIAETQRYPADSVIFHHWWRWGFTLASSTIGLGPSQFISADRFNAHHHGGCRCPGAIWAPGQR